jgi:4-amino-4-deoxy-L-arabinose transferase-like glycosyltransferase
MQTWIVGLIAITGAQDSWAFVLVAQCLNFIGLLYLALVAKRFIRPDAVEPLTVLFCGSIYYSAAVPTMALNADQIQVPIWAGILYHALAAGQNNRWRDWLMAGLLFGIACLSKYYSVIMLAALLLAASSVPTYRRIFRNIRLYATALLSTLLIAVNAIPEWQYGENIEHATAMFDLPNGVSIHDLIVWRLEGLFHLLRSFLLYGAGALVGLVIVVWRGSAVRAQMPQNPAQRVIVRAASPSCSC